MKFPTKYSRIRSYVDDWRELLRIIVRQRGEIICNHLRCGQRLAFRSHRDSWIPQVPKAKPGAPVSIEFALTAFELLD
jgi:hypothetical protein